MNAFDFRAINLPANALRINLLREVNALHSDATGQRTKE
jgi:hypothetical protein